MPEAVAFQGPTLVASGPLDEVALAVQTLTATRPTEPIFVFHAVTSEAIDLDLRGDPDTIRQHVAGIVRERFDTGAERTASIEPESPRGPGRPRLGVVAREVTLLPRHWDWLATQPGGASAALRRLVDHARKANAEKDRVRRARESTYRFLTHMAGNEPGYEEASRALFAGKPTVFDALTAPWPPDVRDHARRLAAACFDTRDAAPTTGEGEDRS